MPVNVMLARLEQLVGEIAPLHTKLILPVGPPRCGKTALLQGLAERTQTSIFSVGDELGRRLAVVPKKHRQLEAGKILREIADQRTNGDLLLVDNIELLFDASLQLSPLDLLKREAHARRAVAVWPGELRQGGSPRLTYAEMGHPEYRDYALEGIVTFEVHH
jgi:hypothetical protein